MLKIDLKLTIQANIFKLQFVYKNGVSLRPNFFSKTISAQIHLLGCIMAILGTFALITKFSFHESPAHFISYLVYGLSAIGLFFISSLYHFIHDGFGMSSRWEHRFESLDHIAIYIFIAASYTAILINTVAQPWLQTLLISVWVLAFFGIIYSLFKTSFPLWAQHRFLYTSLFLIMGWLMLVRLEEIVKSLSSHQLLLFFWGGVASYSLGAVVYALKKPKLMEGFFGYHELWHTLVLVGYGLHFYTVYSF